MSLSYRISRLEQTIGADEPHTEMCDWWRQVRTTVAPYVAAEYREQVMAELGRQDCGVCLRAANWRFPGRLASVLSTLILDACLDPTSRPIAFPSVVARIYAEDERCRPVHACQTCGYRVPVHEEYEYGRGGTPVQWVQVSERSYFPQCPLCGGSTGPAPFYPIEAKAAARRGEHHEP